MDLLSNFPMFLATMGALSRRKRDAIMLEFTGRNASRVAWVFRNQCAELMEEIWRDNVERDEMWAAMRRVGAVGG